MIDFCDSKDLMELANKNIELSRLYETVKRDHSEAQIYFDLKLARFYQKEMIETKIAYEKAVLLLIITPEDEDMYEKLVKAQHHAKAVEKIMISRSEPWNLSTVSTVTLLIRSSFVKFALISLIWARQVVITPTFCLPNESAYCL